MDYHTGGISDASVWEAGFQRAYLDIWEGVSGDLPWGMVRFQMSYPETTKGGYEDLP